MAQPEEEIALPGEELSPPGKDTFTEESCEGGSRRAFPGIGHVLEPPKYEEVLSDLGAGEMLDLFRYLKQISLFLPKQALSGYLLSDERIKMEFIIDRLSGKRGLREDARVERIRRALSGSRGRVVCSPAGSAVPDSGALFTVHQDRGAPGVENVPDSSNSADVETSATPAKGDFGRTLAFLEEMVSGLPDRGFAVTFRNKLAHIRERYHEHDL